MTYNENDENYDSININAHFSESFYYFIQLELFSSLTPTVETEMENFQSLEAFHEIFFLSY